MLAHIRGLDLSGILVSPESSVICAALRAACDYEASVVQHGTPVAADEVETDRRFTEIESTLRRLPDSEDKTIALSRLWTLWALTTLRYVRLQPRITVPDIERALISAQIAACWAAGDGALV